MWISRLPDSPLLRVLSKGELLPTILCWHVVKVSFSVPVTTTETPPQWYRRKDFVSHSDPLLHSSTSDIPQETQPIASPFSLPVQQSQQRFVNLIQSLFLVPKPLFSETQTVDPSSAPSIFAYEPHDEQR